MVEEVLDGRSLTEALADVESALRPAVQAVSFHAMRYLGWADAVGRELVQRYPNVLFESLLLVSLTLLKAEGEAAAAVPGMPVYAPHGGGPGRDGRVQGPRPGCVQGLLNGCLRRFLREREALAAAVADSPEAQWNHRDGGSSSCAWPIRSTGRRSCWPPIYRPLTLRVNRRRASREQVLAAFQDAGLAAEPVGAAGLVVATPRPVVQLPGFAEGWWSVQDAGAQRAAELLAPADGMRVLDACAAPGGKTAHLLELADIDLLALDADAGRLERVGQNLDRLGLGGDRVRLQAADAADLDAWWDGKPFDAVLADVPCTASGIVRRHPDIRWLRRENDLRRTAALQTRILDALWRTVAPGGRLLYVTCSVFPIEGTRQALEFLQRHPEARRLDAPGQLLPVAVDATPAEQQDGFFYALFAKPS